MHRWKAKTVIVGLASMLLHACQNAPTKPATKAEEILRDSAPGISEECVDSFRRGGIEAMPRRTDQCFKMTATKRWTGLLRVEFEGDQFCPPPAAACPSANNADIWASFRGRRPDDGLYKAEFIGRRTLMPGHFGHMGSFQHEVVVDEMIHLVAVRQ